MSFILAQVRRKTHAEYVGETLNTVECTVLFQRHLIFLDIHILDIFVDTWYSCVLVLGHAFQLFYNYRRSIQLTSLLWLVFCRCFEKNCTRHCNIIYFQTIYILSSNFMSVIFSQPLSAWNAARPSSRHTPSHHHITSQAEVWGSDWLATVSDLHWRLKCRKTAVRSSRFRPDPDGRAPSHTAPKPSHASVQCHRTHTTPLLAYLRHCTQF